MSSYTTPQEAITDYLRNQAILMPQILFGSTFSPFYQEVPEPAPDVDGSGNPFPYVWYDIPDGDWTDCFENAGHYEFHPIFRTYMRQQDLAESASPFVATSVFYNLNLLATNPRVLNGANFQCDSFRQTSWRIYKDTERGPDTGRVWIAEAHYSMWLVT